jgi:GNAT superfamily N-acetyltransferase
VLRPGQPASSAVYPGDDAPTTWHAGAFEGDVLVAIASLYREPRPHRAGPGWRLRGMATDPAHRGRGAGAALLQACLDRVAAEGGGELWCNARTPAIGFYRRAGFDVVTPPFHVPGIGPHVVMRRLVDPSRP